ncbi:MAG: hypothetical protein EOS28_29920 [Mesorhizobium sp.]|uniref:hypothetical protein n=1 Tax=Mesorhizobium sp. TaxID=1871066 RepID=UPI000FE6893F|nr:hypothetical protein [Mesorhizobium sp.]RWB19046.1 MAG: hypothetical protein EOQ41_32610 [Mesorhizobium sp.]RWC38435.1 MAG: hypothetical protein EOS28_29920 [Mesorhizobium sp.]
MSALARQKLELKELAALRKAGRLSDEEYDLAKGHVLRFGSLHNTTPDRSVPEITIRGSERPFQAKKPGGLTGWLMVALVGMCCFIWFRGSTISAQPATASIAMTSVAVTSNSSRGKSSLTNGQRWLDDAICSAGVHTYFYLKLPPEYVEQQGQWFSFKREVGQIYNCSVGNGRISLNWVNRGGAMMQSNSATFTIANDVLRVSDTFQEETFDLSSSPWRLLSQRYTDPG